jgi:DICT domain-containing protein
MDWTITEEDFTSDDPTGVGGFVKRMEYELRGDEPPLEGFHFMNSPIEMLRFSREIEDEVRANPQDADLYVGFQTADKLIGETNRYQRLVKQGAKVVAFGQGIPPEAAADCEVEWISLERDTRALENQWYLVSSKPTPIAFVGWETSPEDQFAVGGLSAPGKMFRGFATSDLRVVKGMLAHLESIRNTKTELQESQITLENQLKTPIRRVMAITEMNDSKPLDELRSRATDVAISHGADVVLFEMSAASYLVSPYPEDYGLPFVEDRRENWLKVLNESELNRFGRSAIASQIAEIRAKGVEAGAVLPTTHGFKHLANWAENESVDLILLPWYLVEPGLLDRLRGYSLRSLLEHTDRQVVVLQQDGTLWHANPEDSPRNLAGVAAMN